MKTIRSTQLILTAPATPVAQQLIENAPTVISAHAKAFDLFDAGKMSETAQLVAVGATRVGFELAEELRVRTLSAFEEGRLSEDTMIKLLS